MPPRFSRGEVWWADLGPAAKVRPALVLSVPTDPQDRVVVTLVPHTTTLHGTRFEVPVTARFLKAGAFDAQGLATVAQVKLRQYIGTLGPADLAAVELAVRVWLGFVPPPPVSPPPPSP